MTEKKHHRHQDQYRGEPDGQTENPDVVAQSTTESSMASESSGDEVNDIQNRLAEAEARSAENLDGWQRAVAEFQNFKKRVERDRESDQAAMKGDLIRRILPVLDDLERALQSRPPEDAWFNGIELIQRKLQSILEAEGVRRMQAEGAVFDPNFHEAISQEPVDGAESGRVVAVVQNGYMLGERVIRPAQVKVAE
jgi:molecular chaperone GrpE